MVSLQALALVWALSGSGETALLDFYSDSCGPCRQMSPVVGQLAAAGYPVRKVNVEQERELAGRFGITRIPCFVMVVDGKEVDRLLGLTSYDRLEAMCKLALARRPVQSVPAKQPTAPPVFFTSNESAAPVLPVPAVPSGPAFSVGAAPIATADATMAGWRMSEPGPVPASGTPGPSDADLIAATVRLRIEDPTGQSCGTGTIIDARQGQALILTCGHLFRDSQGKGRIVIDLFGPTAVQGVQARLIGYDLVRDVALLSIATSGPVAAARVAPPGYQVKKGDQVATVGCNNGADPTVRRSRITAIDKFVGQPNVEVAGAPVQGRSGGGLFSGEGYVIGVCNAADPADNEGLFAALACMAEMDAADLAGIYRPATAAPGTLVAVAPPSMPREMPQPDSLVQPTAASTRGPAPAQSLPTAPAAFPGNVPPLRPEEQAALEEIRRHQAEGAEVIFVIRSHSKPEAPSEVFVLDKASPAFLEQLTADRRSHAQRQLTSVESTQYPSASSDRSGLVPVPPRSGPTLVPPAQSNSQSQWSGIR